MGQFGHQGVLRIVLKFLKRFSSCLLDHTPMNGSGGNLTSFRPKVCSPAAAKLVRPSPSFQTPESQLVSVQPWWVLTWDTWPTCNGWICFFPSNTCAHNLSTPWRCLVFSQEFLKLQKSSPTNLQPSSQRILTYWMRETMSL